MIDKLLDKLEGVRPGGSGWVARCPAHEDRNASLSVGEKNGKLVVNCFAGCDQKILWEAVCDLLPELRTDKPNTSAPPPKGNPEAIYEYQDENGDTLFQRLRYPGKGFSQRRYDPESPQCDREGWVWNLGDVRRVLYNLPAVIQAVQNGETVAIVEGEKDADRLNSLGRVATTSGSSTSWDSCFASVFAGANVVIIADRDEAGFKYARAVRDSLARVASSVQVCQAKTGKDASDHLDAGHGLEEFEPLDLDAVSRNYRPLDLFQPIPPVKWIVENIVVGGEATLFVADGGTGKSTFALALSRAVAGGTTFLNQRVTQGHVVYVDEEGSPDLALQRMAELGFTEHEKKNLTYLCGAEVDLVKNADAFLADIALDPPTLVVFDSHSEVVRNAGDENNNPEMGRVWKNAFKKIAREYGCAVLVIHHTASSQFGHSNKPRGATQIRNSADQVLAMFKDPDTSVMVVWPQKKRRMTSTIKFVFVQKPFGFELQPIL